MYRTYRKIEDFIEEHLEGVLAWVRSGEHMFLICVAILLGVLGGYGAIAFREMIQWSQVSFYGVPNISIEYISSLPWYARIGIPALGGLVVGAIVHWLAPEVKGSGIPEVMESVTRRAGAIRARVVFYKALAAAVTIGSGGSAGREGPIVHIGSAIGSAVGQLFRVPARQLRSFVACGAAAGIAATFNAPIAGALFAIEVVLGDMKAASMSAIVISSVVATVVSRHYLGDFPAFDVPVYQLLDARELILYGALGILAGVVALGFIRMLSGSSDFFGKLSLPAWSKAGLGGLLVGVLSLVFPHLLGVGYETINMALGSRIEGAAWPVATAGLLGAILLAKMLATSITLGSGGSGGVFAPSLFLGATLGAGFGQLAGLLFPGWTAAPGAYALVGMGAVVSATTHAPITAILIIFELTNDYHIFPPLMVSCVLSVLLSSQLQKQSIYTVQLLKKGVDLTAKRDINLLKSIPVHSVMDREITEIPSAMSLGELLPRLLREQKPFAVVVDNEGRYAGSVELSDVREAFLQSEELAPIIVAADVADTQVPHVLPGDNLDLVMHLFGRTRKTELPVCQNNEDLRVVGVITKHAVIDAYNRRLFQEDLTGGFESLIQAVKDSRMVEVLGGVFMSEVDIPPSWVGRNLKEVDPRRKVGIEVVLIHRPVQEEEGVEGRPGLFPSPELEFAGGDRILVMGSAEAIKKLSG